MRRRGVTKPSGLCSESPRRCHFRIRLSLFAGSPNVGLSFSCFGLRVGLS